MQRPVMTILVGAVRDGAEAWCDRAAHALAATAPTRIVITGLCMVSLPLTESRKVSNY